MAFKVVVGAVTGSIAIIMDAVNNLSDALSSVITIVGTKLAGRYPDKSIRMDMDRSNMSVQSPLPSLFCLLV